MIRYPLAFLLLLAGCPHSGEPPQATPTPAVNGDAPILPAPLAPHYATGQSAPRDPVVHQLVTWGLLPWEESLAGTAAGLLLDPDRGVSLDAARWAAVRAGYPYPVIKLIRGTVPPGEVPRDLATAVQGAIEPKDQVGVVRARTADVDSWVALVGRPRATLAPFPRELAPGDELVITTSEWTTWALVSPTGKVVSGESPASPRLDETGEWLLEVRLADAQRERGELVCSVPLFVGMPTPPTPLFDVPGEPAPNPSSATQEMTELLADVREEFSLPIPRTDPTLATLAELPLTQALSGTWNRDAGVARLRGAGFVGGPAAQLMCVATTPALCLEGWMAAVDSRSILLDARYHLVGMATEVRTDGLTVVVNLTSD